MNKIIGFAGQMRSGKDTCADYLALKLNNSSSFSWSRVAFATGVKKVFMDVFDKDIEFIEKWKTNIECPEGFDKNIRQALQFIGDGFRSIKNDIWMDLLFREQNPIIISDGRYINELARIKAEGGLNVLVWRPGFENSDPNPSESQIRPVVDFFKQLDIEGPVQDKFISLTYADKMALPNGVELIDYFIKNDGSLESLYNKIDERLIPYVTTKFA
jgi:hypothetical protein